MKRLIAIATIITMLVLLSSTVLAVSWLAQTAQTSSPFEIDVIKLKPRADTMGGVYYEQISDYAVYSDTSIYYCIKLSLPSYEEANAYYRTNGMLSGSKVKISIVYSNIANKEKDVVYASLTNRSQTLYYNGDAFVPAMGNNYVLKAWQVSGAKAKITASITGNGDLEDIAFGNGYRVKSHSFYGVVPCVNCRASNLHGYLVYGTNAAHDVFFAVRNGKLDGIYVVDGHQSSQYNGAKVRIDTPLYAWVQNGTFRGFDGKEYPAYGMQELFYGMSFDKSTGTISGIQSSGSMNFEMYCAYHSVRKDLRDVKGVYYIDTDGLYRRVTGTESFWHTGPYYYEDNKSFAQYADEANLMYGNVYYNVDAYVSDALHRMTSPYHVDHDSYEKGYLNSASHVLSLLNLSYSDIGTAYMSDELWLENFGFKASAADTADWAQVAQITTIPVLEVPPTGSTTAGYAVCAFILAASLLGMAFIFHFNKPKY